MFHPLQTIARPGSHSMCAMEGVEIVTILPRFILIVERGILGVLNADP